MRTHPLIAVLACTTALAFSAAPAAAAPDTGAQAMVRAAHFSPDTPSVDVYLTSFAGGTTTLALSNVGYGDVSGYKPLTPGLYTVGMRPAGADPSTPVVFSWTLDAKSGAAFTALAIGLNKSLQGRVLADDLNAPPGQARVRIVQAAHNAPKADITAANGPVFGKAVPFTTTTEYTTVPAGSWPVTARAVDNPNTTTTTNVTVPAGRAMTLVLLDAGQNGLSLRTVVDGASPPNAPAGPVAAGGGATAVGSGTPLHNVSMVLAALAFTVTLVLFGVTLRRSGAAMTGRHRLPRHPLGSAHTELLLAAFLTGGSGALAVSSTAAQESSTEPAMTSTTLPGAVLNPASAPVRINIPAIAVDARMEALHRGVDGTLGIPANWDDAGWYADGVVPGELGSAVIVGHLDSARAGPAVFYRLPALHRGDKVLIDMGDGRRRRFVVDSSHEFAKSDFPTPSVYGPSPLAELRLITCIGPYDRANHNYLHNLIVITHAV
jgi:sortase (surface protein transpeptidase)